MPAPELDLDNLTHVYASHPSTFVSQWDVTSIRAALNSHDQGSFDQTTLMVYALGRDPRVHAAKLQRINTVVGLPLEVRAASRAWEGKPQAEKIRLEAEALFADNSYAMPPSIHSWMLSWGIMLGVAVAQICYFPSASEPTRWVPYVKPWDMSSVWWSEVNQRYEAFTTEGMIPITPGDGKWVVYTPYGYRSWLQGAVRPLGLAWADRTYGMRDRSRRAEAHGLASVIGTMPEGVAPASEEAKAFKSVLQGLQKSRAGAVLPNGWDAKFIEANGNVANIFQDIVGGANDDIAMIFLGQAGTTNDKGGSLAKTLVLDGVRYDIVESDVTTLYTDLTSQVLRPWCLVNFGREDLCPIVTRRVPDLEEDSRLASMAARHKAYLEAVNGYRLLAKQVDEQVLAEQFALDLPLISEEPAPMPVAVVPVAGASSGTSGTN